jgi:hypothetical protein
MMRKAMVILVALLFFVPTALYACNEHDATAPSKCTVTVQMKSNGKTDLVTVITRCGKVYHFRMENGKYIPVDVDREADLEV